MGQARKIESSCTAWFVNISEKYNGILAIDTVWQPNDATFISNTIKHLDFKLSGICRMKFDLAVFFLCSNTLLLQLEMIFFFKYWDKILASCISVHFCATTHENIPTTLVKKFYSVYQAWCLIKKGTGQKKYDWQIVQYHWKTFIVSSFSIDTTVVLCTYCCRIFKNPT